MPLYVGKSINIRTRVLTHFNSDHRAGRQMELAQAVRRVECIETAGEFGALLAEARLIKSLRPLHNRMLRVQGELCAWRLTPDSAKCGLELVAFADAAIDDLPELHGPFKTRRDAQHMLRELAAAYKLCLKRVGLESGKGGTAGACFGVQLKRCEGVCCGRESIEEHDARLAGALATSRLKRWPFAGRVALREHDAERERTEFHVFLDTADLGAIKLAHLQIDNRVFVFPIAISNPAQIRIPNLKAWMRHLDIPIGIVVNFQTTHINPLILRL